MSFQTVEDMQDRLRNMCDEIDCLKYELEKAAADERAKIVDYIRKVADRVENDPNGNVWGHLLATAIVIEAGEHLK